MLDLQLPARHDWAVHEKSYGKLVMEPFEPGFALTVGIAYRSYFGDIVRGCSAVVRHHADGFGEF